MHHMASSNLGSCDMVWASTQGFACLLSPAHIAQLVVYRVDFARAQSFSAERNNLSCPRVALEMQVIRQAPGVILVLKSSATFLRTPCRCSCARPGGATHTRHRTSTCPQSARQQLSCKVCSVLSAREYEPCAWLLTGVRKAHAHAVSLHLGRSTITLTT